MNKAIKGIIAHSIVPLRFQPSHRSEMVSQLLFGETYDIMDRLEDWALIRADFDQYEGWIDLKLCTLLEKQTIAGDAEREMTVVADLCSTAINTENQLPVNLLRGSLLPGYSEGVFRIGNIRYSYPGSVEKIPSSPDISRLERIALSYINTPYLWGGRSPFGIDCSGFVQVVFRTCGVKLPRDAKQQVSAGDTVDFIHEARRGDLAFFDNANGEITHVGILLGDDQIIHASGYVRIDRIDHHGIFNGGTGKYSHNLRIIRRLFKDS